MAEEAEAAEVAAAGEEAAEAGEEAVPAEEVADMSGLRQRSMSRVIAGRQRRKRRHRLDRSCCKQAN